MMADIEKPEGLTVEQAASRLGVSVVTVRSLIERGQLRAGWMKLYGRRRRIVRTADVEKLTRERQAGSEVRWEEESQ